MLFSLLRDIKFELAVPAADIEARVRYLSRNSLIARMKLMNLQYRQSSEDQVPSRGRVATAGEYNARRRISMKELDESCCISFLS